MKNKTKDKLMVVRGFDFWIRTDKDGYISIQSDGFLADHPFLKAFLQLMTDNQTELDLERQSLMNDFPKR